MARPSGRLWRGHGSAELLLAEPTRAPMPISARRPTRPPTSNCSHPAHRRPPRIRPVHPPRPRYPRACGRQRRADSGHGAPRLDRQVGSCLFCGRGRRPFQSLGRPHPSHHPRRAHGEVRADTVRDLLATEHEASARHLAPGGLQHLAVLEAAGLVETRREGRYKFHDLNTAPLRQIAERWLVPDASGPKESTP